MAVTPHHMLEIKDGTSDRPALELLTGTRVEPMSVGQRGDWLIDAKGMLPHHAYVFFDGEALFVQSVDDDSPVLCDGRAIPRAWTKVEPPCTIALGAAELVFHALGLDFEDKTIASEMAPMEYLAAHRAGQASASEDRVPDSARTQIDAPSVPQRAAPQLPYPTPPPQRVAPPAARPQQPTLLGPGPPPKIVGSTKPERPDIEIGVPDEEPTHVATAAQPHAPVAPPAPARSPSWIDPDAIPPAEDKPVERAPSFSDALTRVRAPLFVPPGLPPLNPPPAPAGTPNALAVTPTAPVVTPPEAFPEPIAPRPTKSSPTILGGGPNVGVPAPPPVLPSPPARARHSPAPMAAASPASSFDEPTMDAVPPPPWSASSPPLSPADSARRAAAAAAFPAPHAGAPSPSQAPSPHRAPYEQPKSSPQSSSPQASLQTHGLGGGGAATSPMAPSQSPPKFDVGARRDGNFTANTRTSALIPAGVPVASPLKPMIEKLVARLKAMPPVRLAVLIMIPVTLISLYFILSDGPDETKAPATTPRPRRPAASAAPR